MSSYTLGEGFEVADIPAQWDKGAAELEKTTLGRIVTSPVRIIEKLFGSAQKGAEAIGTTVESAGATTKKLPMVLTVLAIGVAGYLIFAGKSGVGLIPGTVNRRS